MEITLFIESFVGLVSLLGVLIFFLLYSPSRNRKLELKKKEVNKKEKEKTKADLTLLVNVIRDKKSTSQELKSALGLIIQDYAEIDKFDIYGEIIIRICTHPNTTKEIILNFNKEIENKNPRYAKEINTFIARGLNSR